MAKVASEWEQWVSESYTDWSVSKHVIQNVLCGGPIRYTTSLMLLASNEVNGKVGPFDEVEDMESMELFLDDSNLRYSDYIGEWTLVESKSSVDEGELSQNPRVDCVIDWKNEHWTVFSAFGVAPDVSGQEDYRFLVSVSDSGLKQSIRPIRDSELLRLYGFPEDFALKALKFSDRQKADLFRTTIPKHTVSRIISVIQLVESMVIEEQMESHGKDVGGIRPV